MLKQSFNKQECLSNKILDSEERFMLEVNKVLYENWIIMKSDYKYCYIDFILINRNNLYSVYTEYKEREYKCDKSYYTNFYVSKKKLEMIKTFYKNCYLIWDFRKSGDSNDFFFIKYNKSLLDSKLEYDKKNCSWRYCIDKDKCSIGFDNYIKLLEDISNTNLDK
jgi:hypothetical protein